jgi:hypothetical protein
VYVHVGDDTYAAALTDVPEFSEVSPVKSNDARIERVWIEIVIQNESDNPRTSACSVAEQERSAFSAGKSAAFAQFCGQPIPQHP